MNPATTTGPTPFETLSAGTPVSATLRSGERINLNVRQLPIRDFPKLLELQNNESALLELYTGATAEVLGQLTTESELTILEEGDRVNADFFGRWVQRRFRVNNLLAPAGDKQSAINPEGSRTGSPKSASSQA